MTNIPPRRFRKARLHRSCKNTEAPDSCQDIDFRGCGIRGCGKGIIEFRRSVILSLLWRRISRDISDLIAAGVALSPECRFFGQMPRNCKYVRRIPGDPSPKKRAQDDRPGDWSVTRHFLASFPQLLSVMPKKCLFLSSQQYRRIFPSDYLY